MREIRISVRSLAEYVFRAGSIDARFRTSATMTEGTKAHQAIQKTYGELDQSEVMLKTSLAHKDIVFLLEGRCDGLLLSEKIPVIDEIKSTSRELSEIEEDAYPVHWAQAKCYAYMLAEDRGLQAVCVQLTYVSVKSGEQVRFRKTFSAVELSSFIDGLISSYHPYAEARAEHLEKRNVSIQALKFPFETYREGQRKLAGTVYKAIDDKTDLFAQASTGIGKTISTVFPAVKAIGEGKLNTFYYLTAKTITRKAAEDTLAFMEGNILHLNSVTITAKDKVCLKEETRCQKEYCEFANGYYDRINRAVLDILKSETRMTADVIQHYAQKHTVCPFEFSLDLSNTADAIICDYNYVFDPRVSLKRFFDEQKRGTALLIDEAHNLVDRGRAMFSATLNKSDFLQLKREFKAGNTGIFQSAKKINDYFIAQKKQPEQLMKDRPEELLEMLQPFSEEAERELLSGNASELLLDVYFQVQAFLKISNLYDERFVTTAEADNKDLIIKLVCLDPSFLLQQVKKPYRSSIHFSATLSPLSFYMDMLGGTSEDYQVKIPSPFAKENLEVYIMPVSTRYHDRGRSRMPISVMMKQLLEERHGNYLVFFPSYAYMKEVYETFEELDLPIKTMLQHAHMTEAEREAFLHAFQEDSSETLIGFAVMGGIFSEGVDLIGNRLNGVIVVGVGLPQIGFERNVMKEYFQQSGRNGFDYAYAYPGMNKVLQAGGRLIRSEEDTGTIVLVDDRFLTEKYQALLPDEWSSFYLLDKPFI
ncbi:helicase C-terminal domain-containing protein [Metabacillus indicus]|uniref:helicase C-terminal domain-containing protein n=1 Tax=Metabacillus indicus TaxID=246786 RepID=UPI0039843CF8